MTTLYFSDIMNSLSMCATYSSEFSAEIKKTYCSPLYHIYPMHIFFFIIILIKKMKIRIDVLVIFQIVKIGINQNVLNIMSFSH